MFKRIGLALLLMIMIILAGCTPEPVEKVSLKIGSLPRIFDLIAYVAQQEGLFEEQDIVVEIVPFRSTIEMNSALLAGELDGIIQDIFGAVNLNKESEAVKLVGWSAMPRQVEIVSSPISDVTCLADLKGKEIATATSTIMEYALDRLLVANGLTPDDILKVNVPVMPLRAEMVSQGKVPAAILTPPLSDVIILSGGKVLANDVGEPFAGPGLIFSTEALNNKSDGIGKCIQAWQKSVDLINANPEKYQGLLNTVAFVPESVNLDVPTFPQLGLPTEAEVVSVVNWFIDNGLVSKPIDYDRIVKTSYLYK